MKTRRVPADLENRRFDTIIIGAGINGAGIARDASMRGLSVLLLDKGDISNGTSSWSTRLIHGGLRYLEYGEVGLVRESLRERERLLRIAPHLVKPLPFLIPIYRTNKRGTWTIRAGMIAYDILSFERSLDHHRILSSKEALHRVPGLSVEGLLGAALYYDAQAAFAERLVLENALSARDHHALIFTYARVERLVREGNTVRGVQFTDLLEGGVHTACASVTVNAAGPWVDRVLSGVAAPMERMISGTKGSHIVLGEFPGAPRDALYVEALEHRRPFFIIPWNGQYLIGTTDLRYAGDLDYVEAAEEELDYLVRETNRVIPKAHLTRDSILYTYSGIRPLRHVPEGIEPRITRRHIIHDHAPDLKGLISIVGGKLTTYRNLSEQTVNLLFKKMGREAPRCMTARRPLPGAATEDYATFCQRLKARSPFPEAMTTRLLSIYGTRASDVLELAAESSDLQEPFCLETGAIGAEILMSFRLEMAETLCDALLRRTMVGLGPTVGLGADEAAAKIGQRYLGWDKDRVRQEVSAYRDYLRRFHPRSLLKP